MSYNLVHKILLPLEQGIANAVNGTPFAVKIAKSLITDDTNEKNVNGFC